MAIKLYRPLTAGRRHAGVLKIKGLKKNQVKSLTVAKRKKAGRNNTGKITVRHQGGGAKQRLRIIDWQRTKFDVPAKVAALEYDPGRQASIALLHYRDGVKSYMLAPVDLKVGDEVMSSKERIEIKTGNRMPLDRMPEGVLVYEVELMPGRGAILARSAGSAVRLMNIEGKHAQLKLPSGEIRLVPKEVSATIGQASNPEARHVRLGKAGRMRLLGVRPRVRGKAMNPVDHPHGGGEGSNPIGLKHPKTLWGKPARGVKTRRAKKASAKFIISRRKVKTR